MSLFTNCPLDSALTSIAKQLCGDNNGQIQKMAFWQKGATPFTATSITTAAAWATATAATDNTKVVVTNYLTNVNIPTSAKVEQAADTNVNAMPELQRGGNINATAMARSASAAYLTSLSKLTPYSQIVPGVSQLVAVFISENNQIIYNASSTDLGFDIYNFFVGDSSATGTLGALSEATLDWYMKYGWSFGKATKTAAFDLLNTYPA